MSDRSPRIQPIRPPYSADTEAALMKWMPPGSAAEPLKLFRTMMVHPELCSRMLPLGAGILGPKAIVPPRLREVMIHRTSALTGAEYEWGVHAVAFGAAVGFDDEQLRSTVHGSPDDSCWDADEAAVLRLADELHHTSTVSDELWSALRERFDDRQILELVITAGWYHVIAYVINAAQVQAEPWAASFPTSPSAPRAG